MNQGQVWSVLLEEPVQVDAVSVKTVNLKIKKKKLWSELKVFGQPL